MGIEENSFSLYFSGMTEEACFSGARQNNETSICRGFVIKRKYIAFWKGDMNMAAEMYALSLEYPMESNGRLTSVLVGTFIDGLIAFYFARKHIDDEAKWTNIGESVMKRVQQWEESSSWNFSNKLHLLQAEYYFLKENDELAMACYEASMKEAHDHCFIHEEGLAQEKAATYLLHQGRHDEALKYFVNAKKCYELWGAHALVKRIEKAIAILMPLCMGP